MIFKTFWRKKQIKTDKITVIESQTDIFRYKTRIETRFADFDLMGHVNNVTYFTYFEIGRSKYWEQAIQWNWKNTGLVIRQAAADYILPVFPDDDVHVYVRTSRIGKSSFDLEYLLVKNEQGKEITCCKGKTICVAFDYQSRKPIPIPGIERQKMIEFESLHDSA